MMDWDDDGFVGGYDEYNNWVGENDPSAIYNKSGKKEYDDKGYFESDDEVGEKFKQINTVIQNIETLRGENASDVTKD